MTSITSLLKIDPIVTELLKAGLTTYKKHFKAYIVLNIISITFFALVLGIPTSINTHMDFYISLTKLFKSYQSYTQTVLFYGIIGLIITIITYYLTFRETLSSGELGLEIHTPWTPYTQFFVILFYDLIIFMYLLIWVSFFRSIFAIVTFDSFKFVSDVEFSFTVQFLLLFFIVFLLIAFFLFAVKMSYYIYMLDEFKVPTQALDPIILLFGFLFGILIVILDVVDIFFPFLQNISIIITYLTPGTIIMPILGYSILGFEPLFEGEESINPF